MEAHRNCAGRGDRTPWKELEPWPRSIVLDEHTGCVLGTHFKWSRASQCLVPGAVHRRPPVEEAQWEPEEEEEEEEEEDEEEDTTWNVDLRLGSGILGPEEQGGDPELNRLAAAATASAEALEERRDQLASRQCFFCSGVGHYQVKCRHLLKRKRDEAEYDLQKEEAERTGAAPPPPLVSLKQARIDARLAGNWDAPQLRPGSSGSADSGQWAVPHAQAKSAGRQPPTGAGRGKRAGKRTRRKG